MARKRDLDAQTKAIGGQTYIQAVQSFIHLVMDPEADKMAIDCELLVIEALAAYWLDEDDDYQQDRRRVDTEYAPDKCPDDTHPDVWHSAQRMRQFRCIHKAMLTSGALAVEGIHISQDPL